jgi:hypothetical protein
MKNHTTCRLLYRSLPLSFSLNNPYKLAVSLRHRAAADTKGTHNNSNTYEEKRPLWPPAEKDEAIIREDQECRNQTSSQPDMCTHYSRKWDGLKTTCRHQVQIIIEYRSMAICLRFTTTKVDGFIQFIGKLALCENVKKWIYDSY